MVTSPKQDKSFCEATHRFNIWVGAVSSGKTYASIERFISDLKNGPPGDAMIIGVNRTSIQRNILTHLYRRLEFPCPTEKSQQTTLYGRTVWFVGAPDVSAVSTIQGSTLALAYVDEATNLPEPFWKMLESRLRVQGAKLLATCNPEGPAHWLKKDYLENKELDLVHWNFCLEDNPTLDEAYKQQLKASYTGMWYNRYILGEWALAHGAIYDCYDKDNEYQNPKSNPNYYIVGIDYGTTNATAAVLCAITPNKWPQICVEAEYYYDSAKKGRSKTDQELVRDIKEFIGCKNISAIYIDPAAASLKIALRQQNLPVLDGNNDVLLGIKICSKFIGGKNIVIHKSCTTLREQLQSYAWDSKAAERGEDKPIKKNDHICFTGDTLIRTPKGNKRIDDLAIGDEVITRNGIRKIIANGYRKSCVFEYQIANRKITCTEDHPFFTVNNGWVKSSSLIRSDILISLKGEKECRNMEWQNALPTTGKYIDDIQMLQQFLKQDILNAEENISIGLFGNQSMETSQKDIISITSTKTHLIMIYPIWNVFLPSNIQKDIQKIIQTSFQTNAGRVLLNGINPILGKNGIGKKQLQKDLEIGSQYQNNVKFVERVIKQKKDLSSNFVRIIVNLNSEEEVELTMSLETALDVLMSSQQTNIKKQNSAQKNVPRKKLYYDMVFNISVEADKEYFANDILVSNCDALRYAVCTAFPQGEFNHPDEYISHDQLRRKVFEENDIYSLFNAGL